MNVFATETEQPLPPLPDWVKYVFPDPEVLQWIFWITLVIAVLAVLKKVWPALSSFVTIIDSVAELPSFIEESNTTLEKLRHQVENDHDTNLREELTETLELSKATDEKVDKVLSWQSQHMKDYLEAIARIENLEAVRITITTENPVRPPE